MSGMQQRTFAGGVLVPACSPCDEQGAFLEDVYAALLEESLREPLDGAYLCGGTGDGMHMRLEERKAAIRTGVALCRQAGKRSLVQVGAPTMRDALELAAYAAECGADGISSVPLAGFPHAVQMQYYRALIKAGGGLPAILYYMPQPGASFTLGEVLETLSIEGVAGIKCSSNDLFFTEQLAAEKPAGERPSRSSRRRSKAGEPAGIETEPSRADLDRKRCCRRGDAPSFQSALPLPCGTIE